jgi:hypothetical protein
MIMTEGNRRNRKTLYLRHFVHYKSTRSSLEFSVPTAQKTLRLHYRHQLVHAVDGNNR